MNSLVQLTDVSVAFGQERVLSHINLALPQHQVVTVIGPNGAGKSTLIRVITGLLAPTSGRLSRSPGLRIGYVPQRVAIDNNLPIKVGRFISLSGCSRQTRRRAMDMLGITQLNGKLVNRLSGGELQRVLLARAIARKPGLLVLDEPMQGVDITGQAELYQILADLRSELGCGILLVSHDLHLVMAQTDAVICLNRHICCSGQPDTVSQHPEFRKLFGRQEADSLGIYTHHHDHHHSLDGDVVACDDDCHHA